MVRFLEFGDSALNFELAVWTIDMARSPTRFRSDLFFAIERKLRENTSKFPFRSATCICVPEKSRSRTRAAAGSRRACNRINETTFSVTTITDVAGFFFFLGLAALALRWFGT